MENLTKHSIEHWMEIAIQAAREGGDLLADYFRKVDPNSIQAKRLNDWVSEADRASEATIISLLSREAPSHSILTEEAGYLTTPESKDSLFCWIIDPLDGTTNFLRGFPIWAVSVALEYRPDPTKRWGQIIAGAIAIPPTGEDFSAAKGVGAFRNRVRIRMGEGRDMAEALLGTGFPFRIRQLHNEYIELFRDLLGRCADVRRPGAVAVDLCYTALGVFDGFWELDLSPWDLAAGSLIIEEAGGRVSNFQGKLDILSSGDIVTANPRIFDELSQTVLKYFPEPRPVDKSPPRELAVQDQQ